MKKYCVGMDVFQTVYIEVDAKSPEEAEQKAIDEFANMNKGDFDLHADTFEIEEVKDEE